MNKELKSQLVALKFKPTHADVYIRALGRCEYCGVDLIRDRLAYAGLQIDHIRPSGGEDASNLALSCTICNSIKSDWLPPNKENLDRDGILKEIREYIAENATTHDQLWIEVNRVFRNRWWETDA